MLKYLFAVLTVAFAVAPSATAQGLIFYLPEDGTGVEYEGFVEQTSVRPDLPDGKVTVTKQRSLSIKSVGREQAEFNGSVQACRWIEIKIVTGTAGAAGIDPGPVGSRIYKVLVPEAKIMDQAVDQNSIPNITLPIVKGFRRTGESAVTPLNTNSLGFYPTISLMTNYADPEVVAPVETPTTKDNSKSFNAKRLRGRREMESRTSHSINQADFWVTQEVPFGLARWEVVVTRRKKESTAVRSEFRDIQTTKSEMSYKRMFTQAETELVTP